LRRWDMFNLNLRPSTLKDLIVEGSMSKVAPSTLKPGIIDGAVSKYAPSTLKAIIVECRMSHGSHPPR
ncbi:MAG: hypothetical protein ACI3ZP_09035, partial [Candidatus Cryptobacteroides sp.]